MKILIAFLMMIMLMSGTVRAQVTTGRLLVQKTDIGDTFEVQGTITEVNESSFVVRGELVAVSDENMDRFKNNQLVEVGKFVLVKGKIKNNIMMADEVKVLGDNPEADTTLMEQAKVEVTPAPEGDVIKDIVTVIKNILFR
jgi:hypothetical protein